MFAASQRPVSHDGTPRFASAPGRYPARCRVGSSLLRVLAPRDWTSPGFEQSGNDPVVCVSWEDANAYARWLAQRSDHAYRLPHARELAMLPAAKSERQVSSWNSDCSGNCSRRIGSGPSWRGNACTRPLEAARGNDEVRIPTDSVHPPRRQYEARVGKVCDCRRRHRTTTTNKQKKFKEI